MLRLLLLITFFQVFCTFSQEEKKYEDRGNFHHQIDLLPAEVTCDLLDFYYGHGFNYTVSYTNKYRLNAYSKGVLIPGLDGRNDHFRNNRVFPKLNHSGLEVSYRTRLLYDCRPGVRKKTIDLVSGYNYFQYGTTYSFGQEFTSYWSDTLHGDASYWTVDSLANGKLLSISGLKHHNLAAGIRFSIAKGSRSSHEIAAYYLYGIGLQLGGVEEGSDGVQDRSKVDSTFDLDRSGAKVQYRYHKWFNKTVGLTTGLTTVLNPRLRYRSQSRFYAPRGGEDISPLFLSICIGISFR